MSEQDRLDRGEAPAGPRPVPAEYRNQSEAQRTSLAAAFTAIQAVEGKTGRLMWTEAK